VQTVEAARRLETAVTACATILAVIVALFSIAYTFLIYPQADDLERTGAMRIVSPMHRITSDWLTLNGRWASLGLEYLIYNTGRVIQIYPVLLTMVILLCIAACCCCIAMVSRRPLLERGLVAAGIVAYSFIWLSTPRGEIFYWFPGNAEYCMPLALGMITLWLLYRFDTRWSKILVVALSFIVPGLHEVFGSWIVPVLGLTWYVRVSKRKPGSGVAGLATLASVLGTASVVLAPGIRRRATVLTAHISLDAAWKQALLMERNILAHWAIAVPVFIIVLLAAARMRVRPSWYDDAPLLTKTCLAVAMVPLPIAMLAAICYGLGGGVPPRIYDGFYVLFAAAAGAFAAACGFDLGRRGSVKTFLDTSAASLLRSALIVLAVAGALSLPRCHAMLHEIDPAMRNRAVWVQRNRQIWAEQKAGARDIVVSERMVPLTLLPTYFDMSEDPNWYANGHLAMYYGVNSIRLSIPQPGTERPDIPWERGPVHCDLAVDAINGVSAVTPPAISDQLHISGWSAVDVRRGIAADRVFLILSNGTQTFWIEPRHLGRADVKAVFNHPEMPEPGFIADLDVSKLNGVYNLSLARVYKGKLGSCLELNMPLHFGH
jgi:hypothetical protein